MENFRCQDARPSYSSNVHAAAPAVAKSSRHDSSQAAAEAPEVLGLTEPPRDKPSDTKKWFW